MDIGPWPRAERDFNPPETYTARYTLWFGSVYFAVMVVRYVVRMNLYPDERWTGESIPIVFHWVLASFILLVGRYHLSKETLNVQTSSSNVQLRRVGSFMSLALQGVST